MFKSFIVATIFSAPFLLFSKPYVSSMAIVAVTGAHIKARDIPIAFKYERKKCPVCKGTGWYISGDGIKKVECGYCE